MQHAAPPPPIVFDLDAAESARLRRALQIANGGRISTLIVSVSAGFQTITPLFRLYLHRGHDPFDWVLLAFLFVLIPLCLIAALAPRRLNNLLLRPQVGTTVSFDDGGIEVTSAAGGQRRSSKRVPFTKIRTVRRLPEALFIIGRLWPIVIIPARVLPDDGARVMAFFDEHLVAKAMLRRSSSTGTTIVNTTAP